MKIRLSLCYILVFSLIAAEARGQNPSVRTAAAQWSHVRLLDRGTPLEIRAGRKVHGLLVSVGETELVVAADGASMAFQRSDIREIKVQKNSPSYKKAALKAAIGGGSGVAAVAILDGALTDGNGMSESAAIHLGVLGGLVGFLLGTLKPNYQTIYKVEIQGR